MGILATFKQLDHHDGIWHETSKALAHYTNYAFPMHQKVLQMMLAQSYRFRKDSTAIVGIFNAARGYSMQHVF